MNKLWLVGQLRGEWQESGSVWDFQGIFTSKEKAVSACRNERYFVYSVCVDLEYPHEQVNIPGAWYPKAGT